MGKGNLPTVAQAYGKFEMAGCDREIVRFGWSDSFEDHIGKRIQEKRPYSVINSRFSNIPEKRGITGGKRPGLKRGKRGGILSSLGVLGRRKVSKLHLAGWRGKM